MSLFAVSGGAGFIGSHLCDALLAGGHAVRVLDDLSTGDRRNLDSRCELRVGDVTDPEAVRWLLAGAQGCFHLAAIASVARANADWLGTHRVNQLGTIAVLDAARAGHAMPEGMPVVYASSAAVYGDLPEAKPAREDAACAPTTAYGADKLGGELHARAGFLVHGVPSLGCRFFNVYGPRQDPSSQYSGVISIFAERLSLGLPLMLHGDGQQSRDFVHVADVVAHLMAGMAVVRTRPQAAVVNVCTGRPVSIRDLGALLARLRGTVPRWIAAPPRAGDIRHSVGDPVRACALLGIGARITLEQGLATLIGRSAETREVA